MIATDDRRLLAVMGLLLLAVATVSGDDREGIDRAEAFYTGFYHQNVMRRFWDTVNRLEQPHIMGYYAYIPGIGGLNRLDDDGEWGGAGGILGGGRIHRIPVGNFQLSLYGDRMTSTPYDREPITWIDDDYGDSHEVIPEDLYWKWSGRISWNNAIEIGARYLGVQSEVLDGDTIVSEPTGQELWGIELNIVRFSNLFPGVDNVTLDVGGSELTIVDWEALSSSTLISLGNDAGLNSSILYTGLPVLHNVAIDRFSDPDLFFVAPRFASNAWLFPVSVTPQWEIRNTQLMGYEASIDWFRLLVGVPLALKSRSYDLLFRGAPFYANMEKGMPNMDTTPGQPGGEGYYYVNTTVGYARSYFDPYLSTTDAYDSERWFASLQMAYVVGDIVILLIGGEFGYLTDLEQNEHDAYWRAQFGLGYQGGFLEVIRGER